MRVLLRIESEGKVRTRSLDEGRFTLGRGESADLRIEDGAASREHLCIQVQEEVRVEDLGSRNGTFLGGRKLEGAAAWRPGEAVLIGGTSLRYEWASASRWEALRSRFSPRLRLIGGGLLLLLAFLVLLPRGGAENAPEEPRLTIEEAGGKVLGWDEDADLRARTRIELGWRPRRELETSLVWLHLGAETTASPLRLELNGVEIFEWEPGVEPRTTLLLPPALLREENDLAFEAPEGARWAIWNLRIEEEPRPLCERAECMEEAGRLLLQGREFRERMAIEEGNLHAAWEAFRRARTLLEGLEPKPELYATAVGRMEETARELDEACRDLRFHVIQSLAFGREERARRFAEKMRRTFPSPDHPCHERAGDLLRKLESPGGRP